MDLHSVTIVASSCWVGRMGESHSPSLILVVVLQGAVTGAFHQSEL